MVIVGDEASQGTGLLGRLSQTLGFGGDKAKPSKEEAKKAVRCLCCALVTLFLTQPELCIALCLAIRHIIYAEMEN